MEAIYAIDIKNGLSKGGFLPWKSKKDLKFFANKTYNNVVIMGKNTYFSLPQNIRPLKNRLNIVLTSKPEDFLHNETSNLLFTNNQNIHEYIINNRENYMKICSSLSIDFKIFFIGGKTIYEKYIPICEKVWVTQIKKDHSCDLLLNYDFSKQFKEPKIIDDDDELKIILYEKIIN